MTGETPTQRKQRDTIAGSFASAEQRIIREFGLTRAELSRARTMDPSDPISNYMGNLQVQAAMLVAEREEGANGGEVPAGGEALSAEPLAAGSAEGLPTDGGMPGPDVISGEPVVEPHIILGEE